VTGECLTHNGKLNRDTSFLALKENDEMRQQNKNFASNVIETSELLSFVRKARMWRYAEARREAIEWEDYRRIHYIAPSWFHPFSRDNAPGIATARASGFGYWEREHCWYTNRRIQKSLSK
jgi:hypothetical protein